MCVHVFICACMIICIYILYIYTYTIIYIHILYIHILYIYIYVYMPDLRILDLKTRAPILKKEQVQSPGLKSWKSYSIDPSILYICTGRYTDYTDR